MKTRIEGDRVIVDYRGDFSGSGVTSRVSWENPDTMAGLRQIFGCADREELVAVVASPTGLQAYFETVRER